MHCQIALPNRREKAPFLLFVEVLQPDQMEAEKPPGESAPGAAALQVATTLSESVLHAVNPATAPQNKALLRVEHSTSQAMLVMDCRGLWQLRPRQMPRRQTQPVYAPRPPRRQTQKQLRRRTPRSQPCRILSAPPRRLCTCALSALQRKQAEVSGHNHLGLPFKCSIKTCDCFTPCTTCTITPPLCHSARSVTLDSCERLANLLIHCMVPRCRWGGPLRAPAAAAAAAAGQRSSAQRQHWLCLPGCRRQHLADGRALTAVAVGGRGPHAAAGALPRAAAAAPARGAGGVCRRRHRGC